MMWSNPLPSVQPGRLRCREGKDLSRATQPGSGHFHNAWQLQAKLQKHPGRQQVSFPAPGRAGLSCLPPGGDSCPLHALSPGTYLSSTSFTTAPASHRKYYLGTCYPVLGAEPRMERHGPCSHSNSPGSRHLLKTQGHHGVWVLWPQAPVSSQCPSPGRGQPHKLPQAVSTQVQHPGP